MAAKEYQSAKRVLVDHVESHGFGRWKTRPEECDVFEK